MNILLVEDNELYISTYTKLLSQIGKVTSFKSSNRTINFLHSNEIQFDLIVCDHNILRFENEKNIGYGSEIYEHLRRYEELETPFVHFSSEPCPDQYFESENDKNFYSLEKTGSAEELYKFLKIKGLLK